MYDCPLFNTHHSPVGAWASLTFGAPNAGLGIDRQAPGVKNGGMLEVDMIAFVKHNEMKDKNALPLPMICVTINLRRELRNDP